MPWVVPKKNGTHTLEYDDGGAQILFSYGEHMTTNISVPLESRHKKIYFLHFVFCSDLLETARASQENNVIRSELIVSRRISFLRNQHNTILQSPE